MQQVVDLLRLQDVRLTAALKRDRGEFKEAIASMLELDLIRSTHGLRGEILYFDQSRRRALDLYRNSILHFIAAPSFLASRLRSSASLEDLHRDLSAWLDLFYREFFASRGDVLAAHFPAFVDHFERQGWVERSDGILRATEKGHPWFGFLAEQTRSVVESYYATFSAALDVGPPVARKELTKAASEQLAHTALLGETRLPEAANPVTFGNAVDVLASRGVLQLVSAGEGAEGVGEVRYARGEAFDELRGLRERLAAALSAR
jgi:glycerol-3-phosphate O-acyltransferase